MAGLLTERPASRNGRLLFFQCIVEIFIITILLVVYVGVLYSTVLFTFEGTKYIVMLVHSIRHSIR